MSESSVRGIGELLIQYNVEKQRVLWWK